MKIYVGAMLLFLRELLFAFGWWLRRGACLLAGGHRWPSRRPAEPEEFWKSWQRCLRCDSYRTRKSPEECWTFGRGGIPAVNPWRKRIREGR